jgi:hypothetical protein
LYTGGTSTETPDTHWSPVSLLLFSGKASFRNGPGSEMKVRNNHSQRRDPPGLDFGETHVQGL